MDLTPSKVRRSDGYTGRIHLARVALKALSGDQQTRQKSAQADPELLLDTLTEQTHQAGGFPAVANGIEIIFPECAKGSRYCV